MMMVEYTIEMCMGQMWTDFIDDEINAWLKKICEWRASQFKFNHELYVYFFSVIHGFRLYFHLI